MILYVCLLSYIVGALADDNILCLGSFCPDVTCSDLPEKCRIQNATHNGVMLPSPETCNCCPYCIENLAEGDECSIGEPTTSEFKNICGPGLECVAESDETDGTCQKMTSTPCTWLQRDYDERRKNGTLGTMEVRADCDEDGFFAPYKCIPGQTCYCQLKNGTRIFGEADFSTLPNYMSCDCSRRYYDAVDIIGKHLHPNQHFRCDAKGDYDPIQCIGSSCLCVDTADGAPTYPDDPLVNMTKLTEYTLRCYTNKKEGVYYKKCEDIYLEVLNEIEEYESNGYTMVFDMVLPKCDLDGTFSPVQENATHKTCVDKDGNTLRSISKVDQPDLAVDMNCKCDRATLVMSTNEKPRCRDNGNYHPIQCRRGSCRCVDVDGNQVCPDAKHTNKKEGVYYKKCEDIYLEVLNEIEEYESNGYTMVFDMVLPKCDLDGTFSPVQENATHKTCVDKDGNTLRSISKVDQPDLAVDMNCKCDRATLVMSTNEKPRCRDNGNYHPIQCRRGSCRCVDVDGNQVCPDAKRKCDEVEEVDAATLVCPPQ